jgi:copper resistance protein C
MRIPRLLSLAMLLAAFPMMALAHAKPEQETPPSGSTVTAPKEVRIRFSETLEPALSNIEVDGAGKRLDTAHATTDASDRHIMYLALPAAMAAGLYTVRWNAVSTDGHHTHGNYLFRVK